MDKIVLFCFKARKSVLALIITIIVAFSLGSVWTTRVNELIRQDNLVKKGYAEVIIEGEGTTKEKAELDAKKRSIEMVNGSFIVSETSLEKREFNEEINIDIQDCIQSEILRYWKDNEGFFHVEIKAVIKKKNEL
ncbi:MAG: hypothetical protein LBC20_18810 [Planctomycetaceae bacterium]|jgi:hypothetical protein|nr:hypothetical protein [Planctomycetaceae bacterium]